MVKKKILSKDGATILIALLFFLLCAIAGSVILAAGSAASGRVSGIVSQTQSYYSVTSAAEVMGDTLTGTMTMQETANETVTEQNLSCSLSPSGNLDGLLTKAVKAIKVSNEAGTPATYEDDITISLASEAGADDKSLDVLGKFTMDENYSITVVLYQTSEDDDISTYLCTLSIPASVREIGDTGLQTQITWTKGSITKGQ